MPSVFLVIAEQVLRQTAQPMSAKDIVAFAIEQGMFADKLAGRTPHQTMKSKLSVNIRRHPDTSLFLRTRPGRFFLRDLLPDRDGEYQAPRYQKPASHERILAVPAVTFRSICQSQGLNTNWKRLHGRLLRSDRCVYQDRMSAESNDDFKQVLTYVVVTRRGSVLCFKRGSYNRVESYLRGARCVGFGGHVSEIDSRPLFPSPDLGVTECVLRELTEELELPSQDRKRLESGRGLQCIGILNDDSSTVGRRHFAFVFQYEVSADPHWRDPSKGEKSITQLQWLNKRSQPIPIWDFEYWSQLVLRTFFPHLVTTEQSYKIVRRNPLVPPHLLCVVGEVGSGKSTTTRVLRNEFGYQEVNTGRIVADLLGVPSVPDTPREVFQLLAWEFIQTERGPERLATAILDKASKLGGGRILVDGLRQQATIEQLKAQSGSRKLGILYVFTPPDIAYDFYREREKKGIGFDEYLAVRNADVEKEVPRMIGIADAVLYNWTGQAFHINTIRSMLEDLKQ